MIPIYIDQSENNLPTWAKALILSVGLLFAVAYAIYEWKQP